MGENRDSRRQKRRYIQYKADNLFKDKSGLRVAARSNSWQKSSLQETCTRYLHFVHFFVFCLLSLLKTVAPWGLAVSEALSALLAYSLLVPCALPFRCRNQHFHYSLTHSLEDVMLMSVLRAFAIMLAYACAPTQYCHKPYLYTVIISTVATVPFLLVKASIFDGPSYPPAAIVLFLDFLAFSVLHIVVARKAVGWARSRFTQGLSTHSRTWQGSGQAVGQTQAGKLAAQESDTLTDTDLPAYQLADKDSLFIECNGLRVHYKEVHPAEARHEDEVGILLVHGFGAGAFAWRHIMQPLADAAGCRVLAFDRPAFGLTSRPAHSFGASSSPYTLVTQADFILQLCAACGLKQVLLGGHSDGALLSLMAAAAASRSFRGQSPHVVIDIHASMLATVDAARLQQPVMQQPHMGPLPMLLSRQQTLDPHQSSMLVSHEAPHHRRGATESFSSPSTSEDESGPSTSSSAAPLLQRPAGQRHRRYSCLPTSLSSLSFSAHSPSQETGLTADPEPVGVSNLTNQQQQQLQHHLQQQVYHQQQQAPGVSQQLPEQQHQEAAASAGAGVVHVVGLALLHPSMAGEVGPSFTRLLGRSRLGRRILRPLLRSELGEVANRRAWFDATKLTPEVLELYKQPLKVQGWDVALLEMSRLKRNLSSDAVQQFYVDCLDLPTCVVTGAKDRTVTPSRASAIATDMRTDYLAVLPSCGHLSHEEAPDALLEVLKPFTIQTLAHCS